LKQTRESPVVGLYTARTYYSLIDRLTLRKLGYTIAPTRWKKTKFFCWSAITQLCI